MDDISTQVDESPSLIDSQLWTQETQTMENDESPTRRPLRLVTLSRPFGMLVVHHDLQKMEYRCRNVHMTGLYTRLPSYRIESMIHSMMNQRDMAWSSMLAEMSKRATMSEEVDLPLESEMRASEHGVLMVEPQGPIVRMPAIGRVFVNSTI